MRLLFLVSTCGEILAATSLTVQPNSHEPGFDCPTFYFGRAHDFSKARLRNLEFRGGIAWVLESFPLEALSDTETSNRTELRVFVHNELTGQAYNRHQFF
jgi:hypothetical protein